MLPSTFQSGTKVARHGKMMGKTAPQKQSGTLERMPGLYFYFGAEDGIRTRDPHLGNVRTTVQPVHQLRLRALQSTFCPPNTPQSTQFAERSTYAYLLSVSRTIVSCENGSRTGAYIQPLTVMMMLIHVKRV
jgi:hypothetical protein